MTTPVQAAPTSRRRRGAVLLVLVVLGTIGGILQVVVSSNMLIGRVATDVATAQRRAANLSNCQREALRMLQEITDLDRVGNADAVEVRSGLLTRQLVISGNAFPVDSAERRELLEAVNTLSAYPWGTLYEQPDRRAVGLSLVSTIEVQVRQRNGQQEGFFYAANLRALDAKAASERALAGLVVLIAILALYWIFALKRRSRDDIARAYDALRVSEVRFRSLVQRASDLTAVTDADGEVGYLSPAGNDILGISPDELTGRSLLDRVHPEDRDRTGSMLADLSRRPSGVATVELRMVAEDGRVRTLEAVCRNLVADPAVGGIVWNARDVTDRRALQDQLSHQAFHDSLTGLPNRSMFMRRLDEALEQAAATGGSAAAILIDLDGFKNVNDTLGHPAGDELLQRAAERLRGCILDGDTVARLGGDEFAIVVPGGTLEHALAVSRRVLTALRRSISAAGQDVRVGASIGVAQLADHATAVDLLADADIAMYEAKRNGKGRYQVFSPDMRERTSRRTQLEQLLSRAVALGQIEVYYQPIVELRTRRVMAVEALARWRLGDGSLIGPDVFVPIAEETGLIEEIGAEVLRQASETVQRWRRTEPGSADLAVTVNVSGWQLLAGDFALRVADSLAESGLPAEALTLEITESVLLDDNESLATELDRIKALGVRLAMDDFGAGYSSLSSLLRVPVDTLKIDRVFLAHAGSGRGSLVHAVAELGRTLRLTVVAEGVETVEQLAVVQNAGCDAIQGFLISTPLPEPDARIFLEWAASTDEIAAVLARTTSTSMS